MDRQRTWSKTWTSHSGSRRRVFQFRIHKDTHDSDGFDLGYVKVKMLCSVSCLKVHASGLRLKVSIPLRFRHFLSHLRSHLLYLLRRKSRGTDIPPTKVWYTDSKRVTGINYTGKKLKPTSPIATDSNICFLLYSGPRLNRAFPRQLWRCD